MATPYTASVFITASSSYPPIDYRLNGGSWQGSNNFLIPSSQATSVLLVEVTDELYRQGNLDSIDSINLQEQPLQIIQPGATSDATEGVITRWTTNIPVQSRIAWGIDPTQLTLTQWTTTFSTSSTIDFPEYYLGSVHYFRAYSRSQLGQYLQTPVLGAYFVFGTVIPTGSLEVTSSLDIIPSTTLIISPVIPMSSSAYTEFDEYNLDQIFVTASLSLTTYSSQSVYLPSSSLSSSVVIIT